MQIGELFILRINIHLNGSVLDTPEVFWTEPHLEPVYQAVRSYLEMDQRVNLLTERLDVIADLLAVLKDQLSHGHGEKLEWIGKCFYDVVYFGVRPRIAIPNRGQGFKAENSQHLSLCRSEILAIKTDACGNSDRPHCSRDSSRRCQYCGGFVRWCGLGLGVSGKPFAELSGRARLDGKDHSAAFLGRCVKLWNTGCCDR